ncbi:PREDICTED: protein FAM154B-like, partial [Ceratosolen solmsi marchali]|uniref:Protein FAM154B-like n=1 Tax=Ceratosolen solmsi marchali TaxID=326594 RepID=A0AAJ6YGG8_9HYME
FSKSINLFSQCAKRYVQPPRVKTFAPNTTYCPPETAIDSRTTYHTSYYGENDTRNARPKPILPVHSLHLHNDKFHDNTTNKLSFKPVSGVHKAKPFFPRHRINPAQAPMASVTTISHDYMPKYAPKSEAIMPCGHIRTSTGKFETKTTTCLSYVNPGPVEPVMSYKPQIKYYQPQISSAQETTQKLSFLPYQLAKKENYSWALKPTYKPPEVSMGGETTYSKSYLQQKSEKEKPILPKDTDVLPKGDQFIKNSIYKESFLPCQVNMVSPIIPSSNIKLSSKKMTGDTTNKLSFQPMKGEKRKPIVPRSRKILGDATFMQNITTNQLSFTPKIEKRREMIMPCGHIRTSDKPLENKTTTILSYVNPGPTSQAQNYKPILKYCKPEEKIETSTVNMLSYPEWSLGPKEVYPWARKLKYQPANMKLATDSVYRTSFLPPGYFVEEYAPDTKACDSC